MAPKFCIPLPSLSTNRNSTIRPKHKFSLRLSDEKNTNNHTIQSALSSAKQHTLILSRRGRPFPLKYFGPKGPALELYELLGRFSEEISLGALEISPNLKRISDCKFPTLHCFLGTRDEVRRRERGGKREGDEG
jgi:hypothetical protein